jgi:voltage-gated potassium channel Kch
MWGQYQLDPNNLKDYLFQSCYQVLVLFVGSGEWTYVSNLPWQLDVTRILAPIATVMSVIFVLAKDVWVEILNYFVRYQKDHLVIAGLGDKSWQFIQSIRHDYKVVVVEINAENMFVDRARALGISVLIADVLEQHTFMRINLNHARNLVTLTGNDGTNLELALKARDFVRSTQPPNHQLRIHLHVDDTRISHRLENYPKFFSDYSLAEISFFSVYDLSARILIREYPPDVFAEVFARKEVHVALYYFEKMAERILVEMTRMCHFSNSNRLKITVFDREAKQKEEHLHNEYPSLTEICDIEFIDSEVQTPQVIHNLPSELLESVTEHVVCCPTDEESLELALVLRPMLLRRVVCKTPIMVRMQQSSGLAQLLESNIGGPEIPDGLYPFGMLDEVLHADNVINDQLDHIARAFHEDYLSRHSIEQGMNPRLYTS